jgi:hypothetical protein
MRRAASGDQSSYDAITIRRTVQFSLLEQAGLLLWHIDGRGPLFGLAFAITTELVGSCGMDWPDYLRDQAAMYRKLAEQADDPVVKNELLEFASVCEEVANNIEDHLTGG